MSAFSIQVIQQAIQARLSHKLGQVVKVIRFYEALFRQAVAGLSADVQ
jgi:hypothetical protein